MIYLDFDGVLFDTAMEAFIVGHKAYFGVDADCQELENNYRRFLLLRPFVISAWQYLSVFNLLLEVSSDELLLAKGKQKLMLESTKKDKEFEAKFHYIRTELIKNDKSKWIDLHRPYSFFTLIKPMMIKCPQQFQILSTKSANFILELLLVHGVSFDKGQVWGRDVFDKNSQSKAKVLLKNSSIDEKALFIDDSNKHITEVKILKNIETILANWGYVEADKAEDNTIFTVEKVAYYLDDSCRS
jgi:hypothetical protein